MLECLLAHPRIVATVILALVAFFAMALRIDFIADTLNDLRGSLHFRYDRLDSRIEGFETRVGENAEDIEFLEDETADFHASMTEFRKNQGTINIGFINIYRTLVVRLITMFEDLGKLSDRVSAIEKAQETATPGLFPGLLFLPKRPLTQYGVDRIRDAMWNRKANESIVVDDFDTYQVVNGRWRLVSPPSVVASGYVDDAPPDEILADGLEPTDTIVEDAPGPFDWLDEHLSTQSPKDEGSETA